jgi:hypothetical protein
MNNKRLPVATGCADYFPLALMAVSNLSLTANEQHSPGQPMHWARHKSRDHRDCMMRHAMYGNRIDGDGKPHRVKVPWRALADLQEAVEQAIVGNDTEFLYACGFDDEFVEAWREYAGEMQAASSQGEAVDTRDDAIKAADADPTLAPHRPTAWENPYPDPEGDARRRARAERGAEPC